MSLSLKEWVLLDWCIQLGDTTGMRFAMTSWMDLMEDFDFVFVFLPMSDAVMSVYD